MLTIALIFGLAVVVVGFVLYRSPPPQLTNDAIATALGRLVRDGRVQLLAWIEQTRAKDIFVTGACAETIVAALGKRARVLGPPHQMTLSLGEAS